MRDDDHAIMRKNVSPSIAYHLVWLCAKKRCLLCRKPAQQISFYSIAREVHAALITFKEFERFTDFLASL